MKTIGLTGGIGMGKSASGTILAELGYPIIDTDEIARDLVQPGQPALEAIREGFGPRVIGPDGGLLRGELAKQVFDDFQARQRLEAILHPRIREVWLSQLHRLRQEGRSLVVVVIPLLFETNAAEHFDATVCIACSPQTQLERLQGRGWTDHQIRQRIAAQWPITRKVASADYIIWSEGGLPVHAEQLRLILERVRDS